MTQTHSEANYSSLIECRKISSQPALYLPFTEFHHLFATIVRLTVTACKW